MASFLFRLVPTMLIAATGAASTADQNTKLSYPKTRHDEVVDDYHGTKVADPSRWLADANSAETKSWVEAQNKVTFAFLESIPQRSKIGARLKGLWNYERYGVPFQRGGRYFYQYNPGLLNQRQLLVADTL